MADDKKQTPQPDNKDAKTTEELYGKVDPNTLPPELRGQQPKKE